MRIYYYLKDVLLWEEGYNPAFTPKKGLWVSDPKDKSPRPKNYKIEKVDYGGGKMIVTLEA